jgi:hypothetical protein
MIYAAFMKIMISNWLRSGWVHGWGWEVGQDRQQFKFGMLGTDIQCRIQHLNLNLSSALGFEKQYGFVGRLPKPSFDHHIEFLKRRTELYEKCY